MIEHSGFPEKYLFEDTLVEYRNLYELCQGCPEVGLLFINGHGIYKNSRFGGPLLYQSGLIYLPILHRGVFIDKFKLSIIDAKRNEIYISVFSESIILLKSIEPNKIYYYNNIRNTTIKEVSLNNSLFDTHKLFQS